MLSVPWFIGWALKPYIQVRNPSGSTATPAAAAANTSSEIARAQVSKQSSPSAAKPAPVTSSASSPNSQSKPYPVSTQPVVSKLSGGTQSSPQANQTIVVSKATATKTAAPAPQQSTPGARQAVQPQLVAKQAQSVQAAAAQAQEQAAKQVSSRSITLKMSAEWAQQQVEKFKVSFDEADRDKSGALSFDEVYNVLTNNGFKGTKEDAKLLFKLLDVDKDNKLTRDEFGTALKNMPKISVKEFALRKAFNQLDKDKSGTLTRAEIEEASKTKAGVDIAADKLNQLLVLLDKDPKDDNINYEEFLRAFGMQESATVMYQIFSKLDTDNSGFLTKDEIMKAVEGECELKLRAAKISDLLLAWHKDKDKKIQYNEFVQVWLKYKT